MGLKPDPNIPGLFTLVCDDCGADKISDVTCYDDGYSPVYAQGKAYCPKCRADEEKDSEQAK